MTIHRRALVSLALTTTLVVNSVPALFAHNERIHQGMTDYAYHLVRAMADVAAGQPPNALISELQTIASDPGMPAFFTAAQHALPKLRALRSGLPEDPAPCADPAVTALVDDNNDGVPDWQVASGPLAEEAMGLVVYPITVRYNNGNVVCEVDGGYQPIGATTLVNPVSGATPKEQFRSRDYTGVTLGYWTGGPDRALKDWIFRSSTLETLKNPVVKTATGAGVSALVALACAIACGMMPVLCAVCPALAVGAGFAVMDAIDDIDASSMENPNFTGLGHHIDMKALLPGDVVFDVERGKFMEKAGPTGNPDLLEEAVMALYAILGWHLRHDLSQGPAHYQIFASGTPDADAHADSVPRSAADWETELGSHIQYTPLDNLSMWGWTEFKAKQPDATPVVAADAAARLGWSLHGFGDAVVPMHVLGTTGFGHRPFEESFDDHWEDMVFADGSKPGAIGNSVRQARVIVERALVWRQFILQWRTDHGGTLDVPVRDFVTALASQTRGKSGGVAGLFNPGASIEWQFGSESVANAQYDFPSMFNFQRDTALDGVAASLAFLISAMEVIQ